tara:strand:- start:5538 stop:5711 length:174 start_codon:yes stop_codon:yes gene_type:complete
MIHRAPMTNREMTEEDFKYRQGRSKRQADNNEKIMFISCLGLLITIFSLVIYGLLTT